MPALDCQTQLNISGAVLCARKGVELLCDANLIMTLCMDLSVVLCWYPRIVEAACYEELWERTQDTGDATITMTSEFVEIYPAACAQSGCLAGSMSVEEIMCAISGFFSCSLTQVIAARPWKSRLMPSPYLPLKMLSQQPLHHRHACMHKIILTNKQKI